jgi:hypothetical protein
VSFGPVGEKLGRWTSSSRRIRQKRKMNGKKKI